MKRVKEGELEAKRKRFLKKFEVLCLCGSNKGNLNERELHIPLVFMTIDRS